MKLWSRCLLAVASAMLPPVMVDAQTVHIAHCLAGCPQGAAPSNEIIVRNLFAVSINRQSGLADWVSYRILPGTVGVASLLPRDWQEDPLLAANIQSEIAVDSTPRLQQPVLDNQQDQAYRLTEFTVAASDRGRLIPMSSFAGTSYWQDLNYLSVMSPLQADMRSGPWSRLDQAVNQLSSTAGEVFVVAGPLYRSGLPGERRAAADSFMPEAFYKVIAAADGAVSAFIFSQDLPPHASYCAQRVSLAQVEQRSGLRLFPDSSAWPAASLDFPLGCNSGDTAREQ